MLAAWSSAGVCATTGAGEEHTQVSARAEINRKNARCMVVPLLSTTLASQTCPFVEAPPLLERRRGSFSSWRYRLRRPSHKIFTQCEYGEACASGSERPTPVDRQNTAQRQGLPVANCLKLQVLLASFRTIRCDCHAAHQGIVDQSAAFLSPRHRAAMVGPRDRRRRL